MKRLNHFNFHTTNISRWLLAVLCLSIVGVEALVAQTRSTNGLLALYDFSEGSGTDIMDQSSFGTPLNLRMNHPGNVSWNSNCGVQLNTATRITSIGNASKISSAIKASGQLTLEAWIKPSNLTQNGPARIVSISENTLLRNVTLGQENNKLVVRCKTSTTSGNGQPDFVASQTIGTNLMHVVYTKTASGIEKIYINGVLAQTGSRTGNLSGWATHCNLLIGNEETNDRPWLGGVYLVAFYNRDLTAAEVSGNYAAGSCSLPTSSSNCQNRDFTWSGSKRLIYSSLTQQSFALPAIFNNASAVDVSEVFTSDSYVGRETVTQTDEKIKLVFRKNGVVTGQSAFTPDLQDRIQTGTWTGSLGTVTLNGGADQVIAVHVGDSQYGIGITNSPNSLDIKGICLNAITCNNVTNGGQIAYAGGDGCGSFDPPAITNGTAPSGGAGTIEYLWLKSTTGCPTNINQAIAGATGATYNPPVITTTTWFVRCSRRANCTDWTVGESNCIKITVTPSQAPGTACNDGNANTTNDVIGTDGCTCAGTVANNTPNCDTGISITTGAGSIIVSGLNGAPVSSVQIFTSSWAGVFSCFADCGATVTRTVPSGTYLVYAKYYTAGYQLICEKQMTVTVTGGTGGDPCANSGGDSDGDGICNNNDCQPNNPAFPATPGTTCNDNNPNTTNDVISADGCSCAGTPTGNTPNCDTGISITTGAGSIIVSGLNGAPVSSVQIFTSSWAGVYNCFADCGATVTRTVPAGTYLVYAKYYTANYQLICEKQATVTVTGGTGGPCANAGGDSDGDGICNNDDCQPNNPAFPATPGTTCNDNNPNTANDVITADGCGCAGTPVTTPCSINAVVSNIVCNDAGTPNNANDDTFSFELQVTGSGTTSTWMATIGGVSVNGNYGQAKHVGPILIGSGSTITGWVKDVNNNDCFFDVDVTPPATCSTGSSGSDCNAISITTGSGTITVAGLNGAPVTSLQIFTNTWAGVYNCFANCSATVTQTVPAGTYRVFAKYYTAGYTLICEKAEIVTVTGGGTGNPCGLDTQAPVFAGCPQNITATTNGTSTNVNWTAPTATDNCGTPVVSSNFQPGASFPVGSTTVTYTAVDGAGNTRVCSFTVTVTQTNGGGGTGDCAAVVVTPGNGNVTISGLAGAPISAVWVFNATWGTEYNCSMTCGASQTVNLTAGTYRVIVKFYSATWAPICEVEKLVTVTGAGNPCASDITAPVFAGCPQNQSLTTTTTCKAATWTAPTATDNCGTPTITSNFNSGHCFPVGTTTVTYTATDAAGNTATCTFNVIVTASNPACATRTVTNTVECNSGTSYGFWTAAGTVNGVSGISNYWGITNGVFTEYADGTAKLTGTATNVGNSNAKFTMNLTFSGRTFSAPTGSPKNGYCANVNASDFYYYTTIGGTLTGTNLLAGGKYNVTRRGEAFQIGTGANQHDNLFGASAWMTLTRTSQPTNTAVTMIASAESDINFRLTGSATACAPVNPLISGAIGDLLEDITNDASGSTIAPWATDAFGDVVTKSVNVYPNPAQYEVTIDMVGYTTDKGMVQLLDQTGRMLRTQAFNGSNSVNMEVQGVPSGVYNVVILTEGQAPVVKRLVIQQ